MLCGTAFGQYYKHKYKYMKTPKRLYKFLLLVLFFAVSGIGVTYAQKNSSAQKTKSNAGIKNMIDSKKYVFRAQSVTPLRGTFRQLTSLYDMKVSGDTITTYLPYFGRAYNAPVNPAEGGIRFTSTKSDYSVEEKKKGQWDVIIKPKDTREVQQLILSVFDNGYASLQVTSADRDPISFSGYVSAIGDKKNK